MLICIRFGTAKMKNHCDKLMCDRSTTSAEGANNDKRASTPTKSAESSQTDRQTDMTSLCTRHTATTWHSLNS